MSHLDENLKEIIGMDIGETAPGYGCCKKCGQAVDDAIVKIKQTFADAGYLQSVKLNNRTVVMNGKDPLGYVVYYPDEVMTGQEAFNLLKQAGLQGKALSTARKALNAEY